MSQIDSEINSLRLRLSALEEQQKIEKEIASEKKAFPLKTIEMIIDEKRKQIKHSSYNNISLKTSLLGKFYDFEHLAFLEPILDALKNIQERLDMLEKK